MAHPPSDPEPTDTPTSALPDPLEAALYQILLDRPASEHATGLAALQHAHPDHAKTLATVFRKLSAGMKAVPAAGGLAGAVAQPEHIGRYRILEKLGEGGFGVVYLAEQREPVLRRVALKCLLPGMDSRTILARFEAERQALALMSHSNIAQVYDAGATPDGRPYIAMEFVPGEPITSYCDRGRLDARRRLQLFGQVCAGVQHAHQKGVIHRDLKPTNILVVEQDGEPVPKIIDFGVAKALHRSLTAHTLYTESGRMLGTPEYMSPEQASGSTTDVDTRTDIYALGVVLYELLTGTLPFDSGELRSGGLEKVLGILRDHEPPPPSSRITGHDDGDRRAELRDSTTAALAMELRGDLDWIVMKAMEKDRARRYASASELALDIGRYLEDQPVTARPPSATYHLRKFVRRNRAAVVFGGLALLSLVAGLVASTWFYVQASGNLADYRRLSDVVRLDECVDEAKRLWPEHPATAPAMRAWLTRARLLQRGLPGHEEALAALDEKESRPFLRRTLQDLTKRLRRFGDPQNGLIQEVERRLEVADEAAARSIDAHRADWNRAIAAVANDPRFRGLQLLPQVGLVPLGPDPHSQLQEFGHLRTGPPAKRNAQGTLLVTPETGLVFVLLPGGPCYVGSQDDDPTQPNYDPDAGRLASPVHRVQLEPFFLSKFEMTQAQWHRFTGETPSRIRRSDTRSASVRRTTARRSATARHPVESIHWHQARRTLFQLGLVLPTEVQWEYACRAETATPLFTGKTAATLQGYANVCDESARADFLKQGITEVETELRDGYYLHAPVGSFAANPFGLHDMAGNVQEWCRDGFHRYTTPARAGDGFRGEPSKERPMVIARGGSWMSMAEAVRSNARGTLKPLMLGWHLGVRPARVVARR